MTEGPWITTNSGIRFYLLTPRPEMFSIDDIAHSLSQTCRYNGHTDDHYSVAEHCVLLSDHFRNRGYNRQFCLTALLHECDEPYFGDMVSPLKDVMPKFREITNWAYAVAAQRFNLLYPIPAPIKEADQRIRQDEMFYCMVNVDELCEDEVEPLGIIPRMWDAETAKANFLGRYQALTR